MTNKLKNNYKNRFEAKLGTQLTKRFGEDGFKYESEKVPYILSRHYCPDFIILNSKREKIYIEAKGYFRPEHKAKLIAVKKLHPAMDLRIVFYANKKQDIRWAVKNRLPYSVSSIPKEWLEE